MSFIRQAKELGYTRTILTGEVIFHRELESLGKSADGILLTNAWLSESECKIVAELAHEENTPDLARFALGFDSISLVHEAESKLATYQDRIQAFRHLEITGLTGRISFVDSKVSARVQPIL